MVTLREWLETNYSKHLAGGVEKVISVNDLELMQGVNINIGSPLEKILVDKPVVKYLDYQVKVVEPAETDDGESFVWIGVKS
jgi:hypothetical protein